MKYMYLLLNNLIINILMFVRILLELVKNLIRKELLFLIDLYKKILMIDLLLNNLNKFLIN